MSKRSSGSKSKSANPAIPTALANKLAAREERAGARRHDATQGRRADAPADPASGPLTPTLRA
jgi:hypothetical protein